MSSRLNNKPVYSHDSIGYDLMKGIEMVAEDIFERLNSPTTANKRRCGDIRFSLPSTQRQPAAGNACTNGIAFLPALN